MQVHSSNGVCPTFPKGRLCILIEISTISERTADLTKEEEKVRECSEPSIVITFEPHTTSSEDSTMKEAATAILFAITVVSLFRSKDYKIKSLLKTSTFFHVQHTLKESSSGEKSSASGWTSRFS